MPVLTPEGFRYWVSFIEDAMCMWCVSFLKTKDGAFAAFKAYKVWAEMQLEVYITMTHMFLQVPSYYPACPQQVPRIQAPKVKFGRHCPVGYQ